MLYQWFSTQPSGWFLTWICTGPSLHVADTDPQYFFTEHFYSKGKFSNTWESHSSLWILKSHKTVAEKSSGSRARSTHRDCSKTSHHTLSMGGEDADLPCSRSPKSTMMYLRLSSVKQHLPSKCNHYASPLQELIQYFMRAIFCLPINISSDSILCN